MTAYAGTAELARVLGLRSVTAAQGTALEECLNAAAFEINAECLGAGTVFFGTPYPDLVVTTNVDRAREHWAQREISFGILSLGADTIPVATARDSWERHAKKLAPLKADWGLA